MGTSAIGGPAMGHGLPTAAGRMALVADPVIARVGALLRQRPGALSLAQGMVAWAPPPGVQRALVAALGAADHRLDRYGPVQGEEPLLEAVRRELTELRGLDLEGSDLWVTTGSNMAFSAIAQVLCDPGDEVLLPLPFYFNHAMAVQLAGGVPVPVDAGLIPDPGRLCGDHPPHPRHRHHLPQQPQRPGDAPGRAGGDQPSLRPPRAAPHQR